MTPEQYIKLGTDLSGAVRTIGESHQSYQKVIQEAGDDADGDLVDGLALMTAAIHLINDARGRLGHRYRIALEEEEAGR